MFFKNNRLNWRVILTENYKNIGINEIQYSIINLVLTLNELNIKISSPQKLSEYMTTSVEEIENQLNNLIERNLLRFDLKNNDNTFDFSPFFLKLNFLFDFNYLNNLVYKNPYIFIENIFNQKLNNNQKAIIEDALNKSNNSHNLLMELLFNKNASSLENFIISIKEVSNSNEIEITDYDWLRN